MQIIRYINLLKPLIVKILIYFIAMLFLHIIKVCLIYHSDCFFFAILNTE